MKQKWQYKFLVRERYKDQDEGKWNVDLNVVLNQLGFDGWELVSVVPRVGLAQGANPVTTEELWVFKQPLSE